MDLFKLEKADVSKIDTTKTLERYIEFTKTHREANFVYWLSEPDYLYWDKIKYKEPPTGFSALETWFLVREIRRISSRPTPITAEGGKPFTFLKLQSSDELLHRIDIETGGRMFAPYQMISEQKKQNFLTRGIIEEAIASSQLEGANTTRRAAKIMILQNQEPRNKSERMIINNYRTMKKIEEDWRDKEMSLELLFEIHRTLTDKDSDIPMNERGKLRTDKDEIVVQNQEKKKIVHVPPKEDFLKKEMKKLIEFANDSDAEGFIHPIIKSIYIHFWIGYLHPFTDGNGRMARALFYWYLLKKGYWTMMYLPISTVIKKSHEQYAMAYIYAEQDDNDFTYFYDYHLKKIIQSLDEFHAYVNKKVMENKKVDRVISEHDDLNDRQKQTLHYLMSEVEGAFTTAKTYTAIYNVSRLTAYSDLHKLVNLGYLEARKKGKTKNYYLTKLKAPKMKR